MSFYEFSFAPVRRKSVAVAFVGNSYISLEVSVFIPRQFNDYKSAVRTLGLEYGTACVLT